MTRTKKARKETYYQRWMKGKRKMTIILREEEYEAIKKFCDAHQMSYRQFFVEVAPRLLKEAEALRQALAERESQLNAVTGKYNDLVAKYNDLVQRYKALKGEHEETVEKYEGLLSDYNRLKAELSTVTGELTQTKARLQSTEAQLKAREGELTKANEELTKLREVLDIILKGRVEVDTEYCEKLRPYGFVPVEKGFMKKGVVCTNSGL